MTWEFLLEDDRSDPRSRCTRNAVAVPSNPRLFFRDRISLSSFAIGVILAFSCSELSLAARSSWILAQGVQEGKAKLTKGDEWNEKNG